MCVTIPRIAGAHTPGHYDYDISNDDVYSQTKVMCREFRNLKTHLKRHFDNEDHKKTVETMEMERLAKSMVETREFAIGMRIARICLKNTGFKPPVNVQADKGTNYHRTRQFTSVVTIVPGASNPITFVYLGQPVVKEHDGVGIAKSVVDQLKTWNIDHTQIEGGSFDGQYFHLSVPKHMSDSLQLPDQFLCTWDPLHKGGLVDTHLRADVTFVWLVQLQSTCKQIYTLFNWGKNYEELREVCETMELNMKNLTNFQTTRFANSVRFVFINLRTDYPAVRVAIKNVITSKQNSSDAEQQKKAVEATSILRNINTWEFCLLLSGCGDVYDHYGKFANACQKVNVLPHERYDTAVSIIEKFSTMVKCMNHVDCPVSKCLWPRYHEDLGHMEKDNLYMGTTTQHSRDVQQTC